MSMMLLVVEVGSRPDLGAEPLRHLSRLGVTDVSLLQGDSSLAVLLHGWAFDPGRSAADASDVVVHGAPAQLLLPVMHAAVAPASV